MTARNSDATDLFIPNKEWARGLSPEQYRAELDNYLAIERWSRIKQATPTLAMQLGIATYAGAGANLINGASFPGTGPFGEVWNGGSAISWDDTHKAFTINETGVYAINSSWRFGGFAAAGYVEVFLQDTGAIDGWILCEEFQQAVNPNAGAGALNCRPKMPARAITAGESFIWKSVNGTGSANYTLFGGFTVQKVA